MPTEEPCEFQSITQSWALATTGIMRTTASTSTISAPFIGVPPAAGGGCRWCTTWRDRLLVRNARKVPPLNIDIWRSTPAVARPNCAATIRDVQRCRQEQLAREADR